MANRILPSIVLPIALLSLLLAESRADETTDPIAPQQLAELLADDDPEIRRGALVGLAGQTSLDEKYRPALRPALQDQDRAVRQMAAIALVNTGAAEPPILAELIRGMGEPWVPRYGVRPSDPVAAQWALERLGASAVPALAAALEQDQYPGWRLAVEALATIGPPARPALPVLSQAIQDRQRPHIQRIVYAKWRIDGDAAFALQKLIPLLDTKDGRQCNGAVRILALMGADAREAVPALIAALRRYRDKDTSNLAWALGELAPHAMELAEPALQEALGDRRAVYEAASALRSLGVADEAIVGPIVEALDDWREDATAPQGAILALEQFGPAAAPAVPFLVEMLTHPNTAVRIAAVRTLGRIGPAAEAAIPALLEMAGQENDFEAPESARAVRLIRGSE